jgi:ubiquinone biosynthesis protein
VEAVFEAVRSRTSHPLRSLAFSLPGAALGSRGIAAALCLALCVASGARAAGEETPAAAAQLSGILLELIRDAPPALRPWYSLQLVAFPFAGPAARQAFLEDLLHQPSFEQRKPEIIARIVQATGVVQALPELYRNLVRDSAVLFFGSLPREKLIHKIAAQLALGPGTPIGLRLVLLIQDMPTLEKLGQVFARSPYVGPEFRAYLVDLESGMKTNAEAFHAVLEVELGERIRRYHIRVAPEPLAAASIAQVIRFEWPQPVGPPIQGVFKVHKPGVRQNLEDEIAAFRVVVDTFEKHRDRYPLEQFDLRGLLQRLTEALERDVNTTIEHENLDTAAAAFRGVKTVHVPKRFPELSTEHVLAMELIPGGKITSAFPNRPRMREKLAKRLLRNTVWHALFEDGWFHADPHAGNVFFEPDADGKDGRIAFLDWSLAARLSGEQRQNMVKLIVSIERGKVRRVLEALQALSDNDIAKDIDGAALESDIRWILADYLGRRKLAPPGKRPPGAGMAPEDVEAARHRRKRGPGQECIPPVTAMDYVLDRALARGVSFRSEVLLFKKAMVTTDAVVCDLSKDVTRQMFLKHKLLGRMLIELPKRVVLLPWPHSRHFRSMVSNAELFGLIGQRIANAFR